MTPGRARWLLLLLALGLLVGAFLFALFKVESFYAGQAGADLWFGLELGAGFAAVALVVVRLRLCTPEFWQISAGAVLAALVLCVGDLLAALLAAERPFHALLEVPPGLLGDLLFLLVGQGLVVLLIVVEGLVLLRASRSGSPA